MTVLWRAWGDGRSVHVVTADLEPCAVVTEDALWTET